MKGLLLKDWYLTKHTMKAFLLMIACFSIGGGLQKAESSGFIVFYPGLMAAMLTATLIGYDEREGWDKFCQGMPVARAQYVTAKYLYGLLMTAAMLLLRGLGGLLGIVTKTAGGGASVMLPTLMATLMSVALLSQAFILPFLFRFGMDKGRIVYLVFFGLFFGLIVAFPVMQLIGCLPSGIAETNGAQEALICAVSILLYALSWRLSIILYQKREL